MPFIPVPNTAQLELIQLIDTQRIENVLHYTKASPWGFDDLQELVDSARTQWAATMFNIMPSESSLILIRATDLGSQTGPVYESSFGLPIAGSVNGGYVPANAALVVTKQTALRGRSYRGRIYHGPLPRAQVTGNTVITSAVTSILSRWNSWLALDLTEDEALLVVVSRQANNTPRTTGVATLVSSLSTDGVVDSQRRRLPGRGQ